MRDRLRALAWSAWLGWQISTNWANPWLFAVYTLARPLAASLLLVFMYHAADAAVAGGVPRELLAISYVGNAVFMVIGSVGLGMSGAVVADREYYGMLKYVRLCPAGLQTYLVGRGLGGAGEGLLGAALTLLVAAVLPLGVRQSLSWGAVSWGWLGLYLLVGLVLLLSLGLLLAGVVLNMARHGMFLSEGVGGLIYLLSGAVFPLGALPPFLQPVGLALPTTWWLEGVRRAVLGPGAARPPLDG